MNDGIANKYSQPDPKFIPSTAGDIFTLTFRSNNSHTQLLFIPPFAEEANKSRHILSALGRELAKHGIETTLIDLFGCGDSQGDLDQANLEIWHQDISNVINHILKQLQCDNLILGGLRLGANIAASFLNNRVPISKQQRLLLWQPIPDMAAYMKQFIRLKLAESITIKISKAGYPKNTSEIIASIQNGEPLEISGYPLSKQLFNDICSLNLSDFKLATAADISTFEINSSGTTSIPYQKLQQKLNESHPELNFATCAGHQFWACQEIARCDSLIEITANHLLQNTQEVKSE